MRIFCGYWEEACPTFAIQLTPYFEMGEYNRQNLVYEKEDLLINETGKYPDHNFYRVSGLVIGSVIGIFYYMRLARPCSASLKRKRKPHSAAGKLTSF